MGRPKKNVPSSTASESDPFDDAVINDLSVEGKKLVEVFEKKVESLLLEFNRKLSSKDSNISNLELEVATLKKKVTSLENKLEDTEAYERRDTVVVSGSDLPAATEGEDAAAVVRSLVKSKVNLVIKPSDISVAHRIGKKPANQAPDKRSLIVKFCRRDLKNDILQACRTSKPQNLFVNESLTPTRSTALYGLRQAKKKFPQVISGCNSMDGNAIVWIKPPKPNAPDARNSKMVVNTRDKFCELCTNTLKCNPSDFSLNWPA